MISYIRAIVQNSDVWKRTEDVGRSEGLFDIPCTLKITRGVMLLSCSLLGRFWQKYSKDIFNRSCAVKYPVCFIWID